MTPSERTAKWRRDNPEKAKAGRMRNYYANHEREKLSRRRSGFKRLYGITLEDRDALLATQNFRCGSCGDPHPDTTKDWHTDHCHVTGKVRSLLCRPCNQALGNAKDSIPRLRSLIAYLEKHNVSA